MIIKCAVTIERSPQGDAPYDNSYRVVDKGRVIYYSHKNTADVMEKMVLLKYLDSNN